MQPRQHCCGSPFTHSTHDQRSLLSTEVRQGKAAALATHQQARLHTDAEAGQDVGVPSSAHDLQLKLHRLGELCKHLGSFVALLFSHEYLQGYHCCLQVTDGRKVSGPEVRVISIMQTECHISSQSCDSLLTIKLSEETC